MSDPLQDIDDTEPVELVEVADADGAEPPADWDAYAHDEDDRGDGVEVTS